MKTLSSTHKAASPAQASRATGPFFRRVARAAEDRPVQAKLDVSHPGDRHEVEAERVADHVVSRLEAPFFSPARAEGASRAAAEGPPEIHRVEEVDRAEDVDRAEEVDRSEAIDRAEELDRAELDRAEEVDRAEELDRAQDRERAEPVQRSEQLDRAEKLDRFTEPEGDENAAISRMKAQRRHVALARGPPARVHAKKARGPPAPSADTERKLTASKGGGRSLPEPVRGEMESAFGADFGGVRVHTGGTAEHLSNRLQAQAFTHGADVYFNRGKYQPDTREGKHLLAHELTHVVQQGQAVKRRASPEDRDAPFTPRVTRGPPEVQRIPFADEINDIAENIPGYTMLTVLIGYNPILEEDVPWTARNFFRGAAGLIPFGTQLFDKLDQAGVIDAVFTWIGAKLTEYDLNWARVSRTFDQAWDRMDFVRWDPIDYNVGVLRSTFGPLFSDVKSFAGDCIDKLIEVLTELAISAARAIFGEHAPAYDLICNLLGRDPLTGEPKERNTADLIRAFLRLIGAESHLAKMEELGLVESAAAWIDAQIELLVGAFTGLVTGIIDLWSSLTIERLFDPVGLLEDTLGVVIPFAERIIEFAGNVASKVLELVKEALIALLRPHLDSIPGYPLFTVVIGRDPLTNQVIPRTPHNFIRGFLSFVPGGLETYDNLVQSGAIERAMAWLTAQVEELGLTPEASVQRFVARWESFSIDDLMDPLGAFERVGAAFLDFIGSVLTLVGRVGLKILEFIFEGVMGSAGARVLQILKQGGDAFTKIIKDPIGFISNLIGAVMQGFELFAGNIWNHLQTGIFGWLFGALEGAGLQLPERWDLAGIFNLVLQVLGLTYRQLRPRLVRVLGEETVARLEQVFEFVRLIATEGLGAAWEKILEFFSGNLMTLVIDAIKDWVVTTIVTQAVTRLASMLTPAGAVIQAIIAIYNTIMFFIERINQILDLAESVFSSINSIADGQTEAAAAYVEQTLARTLPLIISFLARLIGLGGISNRIRRIIESIQDRVGSAVDRVLDWIVGQARRLLPPARAPPASEVAGMSPDERKAAAKSDLEGWLRGNARSDRKDGGELAPQFARIKRQYGLSDVRLVITGSRGVIEYIASPAETTVLEVVQTVDAAGNVQGPGTADVGGTAPANPNSYASNAGLARPTNFTLRGQGGVRTPYGVLAAAYGSKAEIQRNALGAESQLATEDRAHAVSATLAGRSWPSSIRNRLGTSEETRIGHYGRQEEMLVRGNKTVRYQGGHLIAFTLAGPLANQAMNLAPQQSTLNSPIYRDVFENQLKTLQDSGAPATLDVTVQVSYPADYTVSRDTLVANGILVWKPGVSDAEKAATPATVTVPARVPSRWEANATATGGTFGGLDTGGRHARENLADSEEGVQAVSGTLKYFVSGQAGNQTVEASTSGGRTTMAGGTNRLTFTGSQAFFR